KFAERDRSTDVKTPVISSLRVTLMFARSCSITDVLSVREWRTGIERLVDEIVENRAMEIVCSGPHRVIEISATRLSILGVEVARLNRDFLHGVNAPLVDLGLLSPDSVRRILAVNTDRLSA